YDPFTIRDFYAMQSFFADIDEAKHFQVGGNTLPTNRPPEIDVYTPEQQSRIDALQKEIASLASTVTTEAEGEEAKDSRLQKLQAELKQVQSQGRRCMITVAIKPRTIRVLSRGNWMD